MKRILLFTSEVKFEGKFPLANNQFDEITRIYVIIFESDNVQEHYLLTTLDITEQITNLKIIKYSNELELIFGFGDLINLTKPNVISGYNICGFDFNYMRDRLIFLDSNGEGLDKLFEIKNNLSWKTKFNLMCCSNVKYFEYKDCKTIDLYLGTKSKYKLSSYKLPNVLKDLLNIDVNKTDIQKINNIFSGTDKSRDINTIINEEIEILSNNFKLFNYLYKH